MYEIAIQGSDIKASKYVDKVLIEGINEPFTLRPIIIAASGGGPGPGPEPIEEVAIHPIIEWYTPLSDSYPGAYDSGLVELPYDGMYFVFGMEGANGISYGTAEEKPDNRNAYILINGYHVYLKEYHGGRTCCFLAHFRAGATLRLSDAAYGSAMRGVGLQVYYLTGIQANGDFSHIGDSGDKTIVTNRYAEDNYRYGYFMVFNKQSAWGGNAISVTGDFNTLLESDITNKFCPFGDAGSYRSKALVMNDVKSDVVVGMSGSGAPFFDRIWLPLYYSGQFPIPPIDFSDMEIVVSNAQGSSWSSTFTIDKTGVYLFMAGGIPYSSGSYTGHGANAVTINSQGLTAKKIFAWNEVSGNSETVIAYYLESGVTVTFSHAYNDWWYGNFAGCIFICEKELQSLNVARINNGGDTTRYMTDTTTDQNYHILLAYGSGRSTPSVYGPEYGEWINSVKFDSSSYGKFVTTITNNGSTVRVGAYGYDGSVCNAMLLDIYEENGLCNKLVYGEQANSWELGKNTLSNTTTNLFNDYLGWDSTNRWFVAKKDFKAFIVSWVYQYDTASYGPDGETYVNDAKILEYSASKTINSVGGQYIATSIHNGDHIWVNTPSENGWPAQRIKIYVMLNDGTIPSSCTAFNNTV